MSLSRVFEAARGGLSESGGKGIAQENEKEGEGYGAASHCSGCNRTILSGRACFVVWLGNYLQSQIPIIYLCVTHTNVDHSPGLQKRQRRRRRFWGTNAN